MNSSYAGVSKRIRREIVDLERAKQRMAKGWDRASNATIDQDLFLDSVALNLHGLYTGIERILEQVASHIDRHKPEGKAWHKELLEQMARDFNDIRPAVISSHSLVALDELRQFRHVVRNIYADDLIPEKIAELVPIVERAWPQLRA